MRRAPATPSRRSRPRSAVPLLSGLLSLLLLGLLGLGSAQLALTTTASTAGASAVSLVDDDGGAALFTSARLRPGTVDTACVGLTSSGSTDPATEVRLTADVASAALAPFLLLTVERGTVPAGGACASFTGQQIWTGTLAVMPGAGDPGIVTGWRPALAQRSVYRFTVTVLDDPRAQGLQAAATFRWSLTEAEPPPAPPTPEIPTPEVPTPEVPTPEPLTPSAPAPELPATTPAPAPTTTPPPVAGAGDGATDPAPGAAPTSPPAPSSAPVAVPPSSGAGPTSAGGATSDVVEAPPLESGPVAAAKAAVQAAVQAVTEAVTQAAQQVGETAVAVAHDGQFPLALVGVVAAFLFLQGRLDRRDPKLALARVREELSEYREFPELPPTETT